MLQTNRIEKAKVIIRRMMSYSSADADQLIDALSHDEIKDKDYNVSEALI